MNTEEHLITVTPFDFFLSYIVILIGGVLVFTALGHIIYQKRSSTSMISWMLFIIFMPYIAAPLYFLIGVRKRDPKNKKSYVDFVNIKEYKEYLLEENDHALVNILRKNGIPPASSANRFELITKDTDAYEAMMQAIAQSRESIDIATYVFDFDEMTRNLIEALTHKAKEGIKVRLLLDTVGSLGAYFDQRGFKALKEAGGEVAFFIPILKRPFQSYINLRNHRKIYLFDRTVLLSGGMNLSNEYMGEADGSKRWKDLMYRLEGPAVAHFFSIFKNDWEYATQRPLPEEKPKLLPFEGESIVQVVPSGPDIPKDALYEALLNTIYTARERIWIVTPYFVPDENIVQALIIARHKGVDVKLITPKNSDHLLTDIVRSSYMRELAHNAIDVVLYEGEMLHAKAILFDDIGGMVGSLNLDNRSLFLNYEVISFVYSPRFITELEGWMETLIEHSTREMKKPSKSREAVENIMKVFAPLV
jgi:cardiolipin synthase